MREEEIRGGEGEAPPGAAAQRGTAAWEDPQQPRLASLLATLRELLLHPTAFFQNLPREGWQAGLSFGLIVGNFALLAAFYTELLLSLKLDQQMHEIPGFSSLAAQTSDVILVLMLLTPLIIFASLMAGSLSLMWALRLMGTGDAFTPALKITGYSQAGLVAVLVPILGSLAAICWNVYLTFKGVQGLFRLSWWQAWGAVLLALCLEGLLLGLALAALVLPWLFVRFS